MHYALKSRLFPLSQLQTPSTDVTRTLESSNGYCIMNGLYEHSALTVYKSVVELQNGSEQDLHRATVLSMHVRVQSESKHQK